MNIKTDIMLLAAVALALTAIPVSIQFQQSRQAKELYDQLAKKNASLQSTVNRLRNEWQEEKLSQAQSLPLTALPSDTGKYVPISANYIKNLGIEVFDPEGLREDPWSLTLSNEAVGWLGLTSDETTQVQNIFTQLQDRIKAHAKATVSEIAADDSQDRALFDFMKERSGTITVYVIPPLSDQEISASQKWLYGLLTTAVGPDRADVLMEKSADPQLWLRKDMRLLIGFRDYTDRANKTIGTETDYIVLSGAGQSQRVAAGDESVPPEWTFLFEPLTDDPSIRRRLAQ